ncbi:MAG: hypothetical protein GKS00_25680 [Alphaproteobacteria bacterium]|nr:hypothetical protein [Alphaproteobacteria bacterium]
MKQKFSRSLLAVVAAAAIVLAPSSDGAYAADCKGILATPPDGLIVLSGEELRTKVIGHTVEADEWSVYYAPDGNSYGTRPATGSSWGGEWAICGSVLDLKWESGTERQRFIVVKGGRISYYTLDGELKGTFDLVKGKQF